MNQKELKECFVGFTICISAYALLMFLTDALAEPVTLEPEIRHMLVTAYCPCKKCCGQCADGRTSRNKDAWKTFGVAADPKVLPYGTKLNIPGVGIRVVDDTGGAMRKDTKKGICHIDVRFHDHKEALAFGRKWLNVEILN
jgi:3D (Asp-Asp-Asp) domain-containing protein